ncbi:MAG: hypothetical protein HW400_662 [Candidatus Levybacteria bacterium]|nr:hypothetical protein [Candidatus Levybacteria bacterium]
MLKVENCYTLSAAINGISTPRGRDGALQIIKATGIHGSVMAKLASEKGDIRETAAFLAVVDRGKKSAAEFFSASVLDTAFLLSYN